MTKLAHFRAGLFLLLMAMLGSAQARFVSVDPVKPDGNSGQNFNRYHYANNNPYRFTDPDGRQAFGTTDPAKDYQRHGDGGAGVMLLCGCNPYYTAPSGSGQVQESVTPVETTLASGLTRLAGAVGEAFSALRGAVAAGNGATGISNPVPQMMARVIPDGIPANSLGRPGAADVFVTAADDIAGMNSSQIANRLTIEPSPTGFRVLEFQTPQSGVASPVFRTDPGFIGGGRTAGGAREFVIPNGPIPPDTTVRTVP